MCLPLSNLTVTYCQ